MIIIDPNGLKVDLAERSNGFFQRTLQEEALFESESADQIESIDGTFATLLAQ